MTMVTVMTGVREYAEGRPLSILWREEDHRFVIQAENGGGHDCVHIDLGDLISWLRPRGQSLT